MAASLHPTDISQADLLYNVVMYLMSHMHKVLRKEATSANKDGIIRVFGSTNMWNSQTAAVQSSVLAHTHEQVTRGPSSGKDKKCFWQAEMTAARPLLRRVSCLRANGARAKT